jgi:N-acetylglucosamine-6-phosphate deacetylase
VDIYHGKEDGHYEGLHAVLAGTAVLAGAVVPLDECARNLLAYTGCHITAAIAAVTSAPAAVLRLEGVLGGLEIGCWADMVVLDEDFTVLQTWLAGQLMWARAGASA